MKAVTVKRGNGPIILCQPHSGTFVPHDIWENLNDVGKQLLDTDWHIPTLYEGLVDNATVISANFSRYVIDANRDPKDESLYPGQNTTTLVPNITFDGKAIWKVPINELDIESRLEHFHLPYHQHIQAEVERITAIHGTAFIYDCHSIRSKIPFLFDNQLPDLNIGDNNGKTCRLDITTAVAQICKLNTAYSHVVNGRFKGGWTTRHYGQPEKNIYALQMELAQNAYLKSEIPPFEYDASKATELRKLLRNILCEITHHMQTAV